MGIIPVHLLPGLRGPGRDARTLHRAFNFLKFVRVSCLYSSSVDRSVQRHYDALATPATLTELPYTPVNKESIE